MTAGHFRIAMMSLSTSLLTSSGKVIMYADYIGAMSTTTRIP